MDAWVSGPTCVGHQASASPVFAWTTPLSLHTTAKNGGVAAAWTFFGRNASRTGNPRVTPPAPTRNWRRPKVILLLRSSGGLHSGDKCVIGRECQYQRGGRNILSE